MSSKGGSIDPFVERKQVEESIEICPGCYFPMDICQCPPSGKWTVNHNYFEEEFPYETLFEDLQRKQDGGKQK